MQNRNQYNRERAFQSSFHGPYTLQLQCLDSFFCSPASAVAAGKPAAAQEGVQLHYRFLFGSVKAKRIVWYTPATAGKAWHGERAQRQGGIDEAKDAISEDKRVQAQVSIARIRALRSADSQTGGVT